MPHAALALITQRLSAFDLALVAVYLIGITLFGLSFRKRKGSPAADKSLKTYFLANNTIPWWAIALSIVSAETSTLTIISIPGVAFAGDFGFLQVVLGYMLGRIVVAALFLPRYFAGEMLTAYQLIDRRFGPILHKVTAGLFLLTRAAAEGVRVFAVSIVVGIAIGTRDILSIAIISALTLLYTFEGGMTAVIWTDVVQMAIYIGGTFVAIWSLGHHVGADRSAIAGWSHIHHVASAAGKFHMFNFAFNLTTTYTFWAGVLGGTFLTMASHGTDQLMVQRLLAARNLRESRLALLSSGVVIFIQFALFLLIGAGLYVFYGTINPTTSPDRIFPTFIVHDMPIGIAGLLVAAILAAAMSNLSAALNSLSSTTVVDFYMRLRPTADSRERNLIAKSSTVLWAFVLFAIAVYSVHAGGKGHVVEIGLSIASVAYGCLLGVFLLGTLTKFATQTGATIGMLFGFILNLYLWQGAFPITLGPLTIPHIAWTWYVLIGAIATFTIGALASLVFRKQSARTAVAAALLLFFLSSSQGICFSQAPPPPPDFTPVSQLINDAIAAHKLPGAVVLIGHNNHIVFEQAYGLRKLAGEPGLDGKPSPAEPMTEDTIFDMASLTKCLATATAIMQLYEAGKITSFDDPVEKYLPAFNATHDPIRAKVTLRMLLTHYSGEPADISLKDPWGLAAPDRAEGLHRALTTPLQSAPAETFRYSDINFILLGDIVETLSGQPLDVYATQHIFGPLGMTETRYLPIAKACGPHTIIGAAIVWTPTPPGRIAYACAPGTWSTSLLPRIAPTTHDDESKADPAANPHFDMLTRGTVHDPTTRRMGGVAGHAGVFSTAHDVSLFAQALLQKLLTNTGPFPLKQSTLQLMTTPEQPGHTPQQIPAAQAAANAATNPITNSGAPGPSHLGTRVSTAETVTYPSIKDVNLRGFGWDIDSSFSRPRGTIFPIGSFGHTGFTGTSLWMDPASNTYVILLANAIHPRGGAPISHLRGDVATAVAQALTPGALPSARQNSPTATDTSSPRQGGVSSAARPLPPQQSASYGPTVTPRLSRVVRESDIPSDENPHPEFHEYTPVDCDGKATGPPITVDAQVKHAKFCAQSGVICDDVQVCLSSANVEPTVSTISTTIPYPPTLTGIDVLESTNFTALKPFHHIALLTNQTGLDSHGHRTIDILYSLLPAPSSLTSLFSPEHGIFGAQDSEKITAETDPTTHLPVISLYGPKDSDKRPSHPQLANLDAVVIDLQDVGVRFYTYETVVGYFLEAAATERTTYHHDLEIILLDRPNPLGGLAVQGPVSDPGAESYINYMPLPVRNGLTLGELARYINGTKHLNAHLTVIPMQHWTRSEFFDQTGLTFTPPSPNLRTLTAATFYPGLGFLDFSGISVGRGTPTPFELFAGCPAPSPQKKPVILSEGRSPQSKDLPPSQPTTMAKIPLTTEAPEQLWFNAATVADTLNARHIPGVLFTASTMTVAEDKNHYPCHGQTVEAVRLTLTDRLALDSPEMGIEILSTLHTLYPTHFSIEKTSRLIANRATLDAITRGDDPRTVAASWKSSLDAFRSARAPYLLYP